MKPPADPFDPLLLLPPTPPRAVPAWRPWLLAFGLWLAVVAAASLALWHLRRVALDAQGRELALLSLALTDGVERGLRGAEEGLQAMRVELDEGRLATDGADAQRALRSRVLLMPLVQALWLLDRDGRVRAASDATPAPALSSFPPAADRLAADGTPAISRPFADARVRQSLVALALRFGEAAGSTAAGTGWVVAAIPVNPLMGAFDAALRAADARMAIVRDDGVRLASTNTSPPTLDEAALARRLAHRPSLEVRRLGDGSDHLVSLHDVPRYGIKVVLSRDLGAVLGAWRDTARLTALAAALLAAVAAAALHGVQRAERRRARAQQALQDQRTRASRLESLGTLAGGVAHDFNNVLAGIVGYGEMAQETAAGGGDPTRQIGRLLQAAQRGRALVDRILSFSRGGTALHATQRTVFPLQPLVDEVLDLLAASLPAGVRLERALGAPDARLLGDPTQAFEAVMNLCTNARQAMPAGGTLGVRLRRLSVAAPRVLSHSRLSAGDHLVLEVSDDGTGIPPDVMDRLFEPFFTTRGAAAGTGLGLAVVHGVVADFGGAIDVRSRPGQGARFTLYLPACGDDAPGPSTAEAQPAAPAAHRDEPR